MAHGAWPFKSINSDAQKEFKNKWGGAFFLYRVIEVTSKHSKLVDYKDYLYFGVEFVGVGLDR